MTESEKDLSELRQKLVLMKSRMDQDAPNHGFESALAIAMKAGGVEEAIRMVDESLVRARERRSFSVAEKPLTVRRQTPET